MQVLSRQRGVSLIEVMVAVLVFSIGILGLALLQTKTAQFTKESGSRTAAIIQARSLADAMRANPVGAKPPGGVDSFYLYDGSTNYTQADCDATSLASAQDVAKRDLACWIIGLKKVIPAPPGGGQIATVTKDATLGTLTVRVSWTGAADVGGDGSQSYSFSYLP
jgi:type IV pilus assembly protein PilV